MKVAWFAEDLNNDKKVCNYVPPSIKNIKPEVDLLHSWAVIFSKSSL